MTDRSVSVPRPDRRGAAGAGAGAPEARRTGGIWSQEPIQPAERAGDASPAPPLPEGRFINRELSWLEFGARLLLLASDDRIPLFERVKFLAIFSEGLDEFFQVRVAGLEDQVAAGLRTRSPDGMSPAQQLAAITDRATQLVDWQSQIFADQVAPALSGFRGGHGRLAHPRPWGPRPPRRRVQPADLPHPHPAGRGPGPSLPLHLRPVAQPGGAGGDPGSAEERIARVKVPPLLPRFVVLPDHQRFVPVEQVIAAHLDTIFPSMTVIEHHAFRLTRNADLPVEEDEAGNLLAAVELELHRRRFGQAVRLEVSAGISADLLEMLIAEVDVPEGNVYLFDVPIDLSGLGALIGTDRPDLQATPWTPVTPPSLAGGLDVFSVLRDQGRAGPPSVRVVRRLGGGVRRPGRRGPRRAGHQADPVPDRGQQPGGGGAGPRLPGRQAGDRGGRAPGAFRRADQHRMGPYPRGGGGTGHLRPGHPQDPRQDLGGGAA